MTATPDALLREELDHARRVSAASRLAMTRKLEMLEVRVQETVTDVKQIFDFDYQMQHRPWLMVGGAVLVGYTLAWLVSAPRTSATSRSAVLDSPFRQPGSAASAKGAVLDVVTGTLWAMALRLLSPDIHVHREDAGRPEPPFHPPTTSASAQAQATRPSHEVVSEMS